MSSLTQTESTRPDARSKLLDAARSVIRTKGYCAATVDELCSEAGVTKGAFFHHFKSKEHLGVAAADNWSKVTGQFFETAPYHDLDDPLDRFVGYIRFRKAIIRGALPEFTCLVGTMVQETYDSAPAIRDACASSIWGHAASLVNDIEAAKALYAPEGDWSAQSLALHSQAVIQGAFILAKAGQNREVATDSLDHLLRYVGMLFDHADTKDADNENRTTETG